MDSEDYIYKFTHICIVGDVKIARKQTGIWKEMEVDIERIIKRKGDGGNDVTIF